MPASLLDRASEGKLAYLSRKLPTFASDNDVSRLVLVRDGQTFELDRASGDFGAWTVDVLHKDNGRNIATARDPLTGTRFVSAGYDFVPDQLYVNQIVSS